MTAIRKAFTGLGFSFSVRLVYFEDVPIGLTMELTERLY